MSVVASAPPLGDFDANGALDANDVDALVDAILGDGNASFDLNADGVVDLGDHAKWVHDLKGTWLGDANLDGEFNAGDFVTVFQAGQYEDGVDLNSTWATGDWNGDKEFDTGDLVAAFQDGGFETGPRVAVTAVPETSSSGLLCIGLLGTLRFRKRR